MRFQTPSHLLTTLNTPIKHFAAPTFTKEKGMQEQVRWEAAAGLSICRLLITELSQKARNSRVDVCPFFKIIIIGLEVQSIECVCVVVVVGCVCVCVL
ncbi:unnamed protein product [Arctogadus glacialis]